MRRYTVKRFSRTSSTTLDIAGSSWYIVYVRTNDRQNYGQSCCIVYHFVWAPMRCRAVLVGDAAARLDMLLHEKAVLLEIVLRGLEIKPARVYLAVEAPPTLAPHRIACGLKAHSSGVLRREFKELTTIPTLWTREYLVVAGDDLPPDEIQRRYESMLPPRRPRGRPGRPGAPGDSSPHDDVPPTAFPSPRDT